MFVLISETGMFHYCFLEYSLMMLWRNTVETLIISMETFLIFIVFVVLTSESLMFLCYFIDDSLMYLWRTIEVTAKISLQALMTFKGFFDLISETLMFHCCFLDDSLMTLWGHFWNIDNFDGNFFDLYCYCGVNLWVTDVSLLLHRWFFDVSLENHWSYSEDFVASINDL